MSEYLNVSELNLRVKSLVESDFSFMRLLVVGEVSTLTKHYTGHYYFTLKDNNSQIKCMMFASYASKIDFSLENGNQVLIEGYLGVYEKGGTYQLYCRKISLYGEGEYLLKLAKLKEQLEKEGLFDRKKKKLPYLPKRIGLITASTGAAVYDYISTIKKRFNTEVCLFPCLVQGDGASKSILDAIKQSLNFDIDLLVITRGGGSKEDLKVFNDEALVRFVSNLEIPVISAIGHTIDTTLLDYVTDQKCITPTDAANCSVPDKEDVNERINNLINLINYKINRILEKKNEQLILLNKNIELYSPKNQLINLTNKINLLIKKSEYLIKNKLDDLNYQIDKLKQKFNYLHQNIINGIVFRFNKISQKLEYLNPYLILNSGYSMVENKKNQVLTSIKEVNIGETLKIRLKDGIVITEVKEKK